MQKNIVLRDLTKPEGVKVVADYFKELFDFADVLYLTSDPDGAISERRGKIALSLRGGLYYLAVNVDGGTTWKEVQIA